MSKITRADNDDEAPALKAIKLFRFVEIYMTVMNGGMAAFMYFGVPTLHVNMPDSNRTLLTTLLILAIPIEIIIMEIVIWQKKKKLGGSERPSINSSRL